MCAYILVEMRVTVFFIPGIKIGAKGGCCCGVYVRVDQNLTCACVWRCLGMFY